VGLECGFDAGFVVKCGADVVFVVVVGLGVVFRVRAERDAAKRWRRSPFPVSGQADYCTERCTVHTVDKALAGGKVLLVV